MQSAITKPYRLSFYANKRGSYNNKRFTFDCSTPYKVIDLIYLFNSHGNRYNSIYVTDLNLRINYSLPVSIAENYGLTLNHFNI